MSDQVHGINPLRTADEPDIVPCAICGDNVQHVDKMMVEKEIIHKECFACAFCERKMQMGYCVQELALRGRYGPCWYCTLICAHMPLAKKEQALKDRGVEVQKPHTRRPGARPAAATGAAAYLLGGGGGSLPKELEEAEKLIKSYVDKAAAVEAPAPVAEAVAVPEEAAKKEPTPELDVEELPPPPQTDVDTAAAVEGEAAAMMAECVGADEAAAGAEGGKAPPPPAKAVAIDDYANKYRLQTKKK